MLICCTFFSRLRHTYLFVNLFHVYVFSLLNQTVFMLNLSHLFVFFSNIMSVHSNYNSLMIIIKSSVILRSKKV